MSSFAPRCASCAPHELEPLLYHLPTVAENATNEWAASFARSIVRQSLRRGWNPSTKPLPIMRELVSEVPLVC